MNELAKVFEYHGAQVRTVLKDGEPWFVASDITKLLDIQNATQALYKLDDDERSMFNIGRQGEANIVNEYGLYNLILSSRKPEAKEFKRWVTHEVIPSIRKTGTYIAPTVDSKMLFQIAQALEEKEQQIALMKPKADFFDAVADSKDAIEMSTAAKVLNMGIGRTKLFEFLRQEGVLMGNNQPYQEYIDRGYFRTVEQKYTKPDGSTNINIKTLVYQRGLDYIRKLLKKAG